MVHQHNLLAAPMTTSDLVARTPWFGQLPEREQAQVLEDVREVDVGKGATLWHRGDILQHWCGTIEGLLKWTVSARNGRSVTLAGLSAGSWFGEGAVINRKPIGADVIALRPSRVALMPLHCFERLRSLHPSFDRFLVQQLNERMYWFIDGIAANHLLDTDQLVARALVGLFHPWLHPGSDARLSVSQDEIANLSGLSRQRCNEALRRMVDDGLITTRYGSIEVIDLTGLRQRIA